jgi:hypothetical protein
LQELPHEDDHCDDQQELDEASQGRGGDESQEYSTNTITKIVQSMYISFHH